MNKNRHYETILPPTKEKIREIQHAKAKRDAHLILGKIINENRHMFAVVGAPIYQSVREPKFCNRFQEWILKRKKRFTFPEGTLNLDNGKLSYLPPVLADLNSVKYLNLANNEFRAVPEEIEEFQNLRNLNLSGNQIERVPSEVGKLTNLQKLDLSNNKIRQLPYQVKSLPNCEIVLDGNPIAEKRDGEELESSPKRQKPDQ